ncbi:hypothetical protein VN97_g7068, partial [Penicillium thymicola]
MELKMIECLIFLLTISILLRFLVSHCAYFLFPLINILDLVLNSSYNLKISHLVLRY